MNRAPSPSPVDRFEFATAGRIRFGAGTLEESIPAMADLGRRVFLIHGKSGERAEALASGLRDRGCDVLPFSLSGEPTVEGVSAAADQARIAERDIVIGMGGGSVIDAAKAVAALVTNPGDPLKYLEVIGSGKPLDQRPVPCVAIPTTAGTGAEVTRNAVLRSEAHRVKVSLRSPLMLPDLAVVDPVPTRSLPPDMTAYTGMDALTQDLEAFVSRKANPLTDGFCREGLARAARSLMAAFQNGEDMAAREEMALASLFGGLALANGGLGAVHGFAAPIGGAFDAPHGAVCARLLPFVMAANIGALGGDEPTRYDEVARIVTGDVHARAAEGVAWVHTLCAALEIPGLSSWGITPADLPAILEKGKRASSMKGNPADLSDDVLLRILESSL